MKEFFLFTFCLFVATIALAQNNVGIGTTTPDASAQLDVKATDKGFLMPRMTEVQRNAIISPATGLMVYQTNNSGGTYYFDGTQWRNLSDNLGNHQATQTLNMDTNKIVNVPTPVNGLDAVNKDYVDAAIAGGGGSGSGGSFCCTYPIEVAKQSHLTAGITDAWLYCDTLTEGGNTDWHVPYFEELLYARMGYLTFPDSYSTNYNWTRNVSEAGSPAWLVFRLSDGVTTAASAASSNIRVRCVRY